MSEEAQVKIIKPWYRRIFTWVLIILLLGITGIGVFIYNNFNNLLSEALHKSFEKSIISDVYELQFENLWVNVLDGDIRVSNVVIEPRKKPLADYPYINSSFRLTTKKLSLKNVKLKELLRNSTLILEKIEIDKPEVMFNLAGEIHVLFPFKDSTGVNTSSQKKQTIDAFLLKSFELKDANLRVSNLFEKREFEINKLNIALNDLYLNQNYGVDSVACKSIDLSIHSAIGTMMKSSLQNFKLKDFKFNLANIEVQKFITSVNFKFSDFNTELSDLDIQTADSMFHIALKSFGLSYKNKSLKLSSVQYEPNVSEKELQKNEHYQKSVFSGSVKSIEFAGLNFDSLIYNRKLFVDEIIIDGAVANFYKDKTKPMDLNKFPEYPGQQLSGISMPFHIKKVIAKNSTINNRELKPDRKIAKVVVGRVNATISNVTNLEKENPLNLKGNAWLENKVLFNVDANFDYNNPRFSIKAKIPKFNISSLNTLLNAYTPAKTNSGVVDEIYLDAIAYKTNATGTFKFLYKDLKLDLQLKDQAEWKSTLGEFAANTVLGSSNPAENKPPRIVSFTAQRDMNKGFINIIIKSLLEGIKQTIIPSKENRKAYSKTKKEWQRKQKN